MTDRVVVTFRANADAIAAFRYKVDHYSALVAARWYAGHERAIAKLSKFPDRHPIAEEESERSGITLRQMVYGKKPGTYRLLYPIEGDAVILHYIRHSARGLIDPDVE